MFEEWNRGDWIKLTVSVVLAVQILAYVLKSWILKLDSAKVPPGKLTWPLWDETLQFMAACADFRNPDKWLDERRAQYGDVFKARVFGCPTVFVLGSKANRWVLSNENILFRAFWPKSIRVLYGSTSVTVVHGAQHRRIRLYVEQFLGTDATKRFASTVNACVVRELEKWQNQGVVKAYPALHEMMIKVATQLTLGGAQDVDAEKLHRCFMVLHNNLVCLPINLPGTPFRKAIRARDEIHKVIYCEIQKRRAEWNAGLSPVGKGGRFSSKNVELARDLLDLFMFCELHPDSSSSKQWEFTNTEIAENLLVVMQGAHGTTASTLSSTFSFLASRPDIVRELLNESASLAETKRPGEALSWADTKKLPYMRNVILETLRIRSTIPQLNKQTMRDVEFEGYKIPKGWAVTCCQRQTHNKEQNFPSPEVFDPNRFNQKTDIYSFVPFGRGARMCPGDRMAMTMMHVFLYHFMRKFDWELVNPNEEFILYFDPHPKQDLAMKLTPRKART